MMLFLHVCLSLAEGNRSEMEEMFLGKNQPTRLVSKEDSVDME